MNTLQTVLQIVLLILQKMPDDVFEEYARMGLKNTKDIAEGWERFLKIFETNE